jgi:endogenous inhibitor of DNA gyrase (YacG/DUF329 family)
MSNAVCPICKKACARYPENAAFPFCSKQCKLADLGNWIDGRYAIPTSSTDLSDDEFDTDDSLH